MGDRALFTPSSGRNTNKFLAGQMRMSTGPYENLKGPQLAQAALLRGGEREYGPVVQAPASGKHTATVILLHGLGDTGYGWAPVADAFDMPHVKFLFPTAPNLPVTLNGGMKMPSWFDIFSLDPEDTGEDDDGILQSAAYLINLVDKEIKAGIDPKRIIIAGFSQGGAVALASSLMLDKPVGGFLIMSSWLPWCVKTWNAENTPVFQCHGESDYVVQHEWGHGSHKRLLELGVRAEFKSYRGLDHGWCEPEQNDVAAFLRERLP